MPILITNIGSIARQVIDQLPEMSIMGATSRGIFLRAGPSRVLFVSLEPYRGPLTLNLSESPDALHGMEPGDPVRVEDSSLLFPRTGLRLPMRGADEWKPAPPVDPADSAGAVRSRLAVVSGQIAAEPAAAEPVAFSAEDIDALREGLRARSARATTEAVERLLGRGGGLTPSGDDLAIGLLLALNRWRTCFSLSMPVELINQQICQSADRKTTTLSANLIECAAQGLADERLIHALDGLVTGAPDAPICAFLLRGWGHHSGCDAFAGMALALQESNVENV